MSASLLFCHEQCDTYVIILFTMWDVVYNSNSWSQYRFEWFNFVRFQRVLRTRKVEDFRIPRIQNIEIGFSNFTIYDGGHIKWRIGNHSKIKKIINILYREVVEIENKFNKCRLFWKLMNIALDLDSFNMSEFCLHILYD